MAQQAQAASILTFWWRIVHGLSYIREGYAMEPLIPEFFIL